MSQVTLTSLMDQIKTLPLSEQRALNSLLVANIRLGHRQAAVMKSVAYKVGDVVKFDGKTRGPIIIEITGFSRDLTKIKGRQLNDGWKTKAGVQWTVGATIVWPSTREEAIRISN